MRRSELLKIRGSSGDRHRKPQVPRPAAPDHCRIDAPRLHRWQTIYSPGCCPRPAQAPPESPSHQPFDQRLQVGGGSFIDTARAYDRSERVIGVRSGSCPVGVTACTWRRRSRFILTSSGLRPDEVFPGSHLRESLETSLRELGRDHVDLLQLHTWE
ncbi:aldo/keto reductase, partial [Streptomyces canus]|uniref:aldo/keto reductase n=1 Tax=Streptomyces canus TaxID=58343 RepID=UPI0033FA5AC2